MRTVWQHEWAESFEKLADAVGRGIRYGEAPDREAGAAVELAKEIAGLIGSIETFEARHGSVPGLEEHQAGLRELLARQRRILNSWPSS